MGDQWVQVDYADRQGEPTGEKYWVNRVTQETTELGSPKPNRSALGQTAVYSPRPNRFALGQTAVYSPRPNRFALDQPARQVSLDRKDYRDYRYDAAPYSRFPRDYRDYRYIDGRYLDGRYVDDRYLGGRYLDDRYRDYRYLDGLTYRDPRVYRGYRDYDYGPHYGLRPYGPDYDRNYGLRYGYPVGSYDRYPHGLRYGSPRVLRYGSPLGPRDGYPGEPRDGNPWVPVPHGSGKTYWLNRENNATTVLGSPRPDKYDRTGAGGAALEVVPAADGGAPVAVPLPAKGSDGGQ